MRDRLRTDDRLRSATRFAVGLVLVDVAVVSLFGADATAVIGSFAAIIHLYFLDFDGTWRERLLGHGAAAAVGAGAVLDPTRALARERLLAGDVCAFHADRPGGAATAAAIATWWERALRDAR